MTTHSSIPAERLLWAVLEDPATDHLSARARRQRRDFRFEAVLPVPIESVHAIYHRVDPTRVLAVGCPHERLGSLADGTLSLTPESIPEHVAGVLGDGTCDPALLELLTGPHEPIAVQRLRQRGTVQIAVVGVLAVSLLSIGLWRRASAERTFAAQATAAIQGVHEDVLGPASRSGPRHHEVTGLLRTLRSTHTTATDATAPGAERALATMLAGWPDAVPARTRTIRVSPTSITVEATLASAEDAEALASGLDMPAPWSVTTPRIQRTRNGVEVQLRADRPVADPPQAGQPRANQARTSQPQANQAQRGDA